MKKLNKDIFIQKSNDIHNNKFDYNLVDYKNMRTKVKIICPNCGVFEQSPDSHMRGFGCYRCNIQTKDSFINKEVIINSVSFGGNEFFNPDKPFTATYPDNTIIFNLSFLDYTSQGKISYRYKT